MTKRVLALLLAIFMLLALFSACANEPDDSSDDSGDSSNVADSGNDTQQTDDSDGDTDDPVETEPLHLEWMGRESHNWTYTLEEAQRMEFETLTYYNDLMLEKHNLVVDVSPIDNEAYRTTLSGYLAANAAAGCLYFSEHDG